MIALLLAAPALAGAQTGYVFVDTDPAGQLTNPYWYRLKDGDLLVGEGTLNGAGYGGLYGVPGAYQVVAKTTEFPFVNVVDWSAAGFGIGNYSTYIPFPYQWIDAPFVVSGATITLLESLVTGGAPLTLGKAIAVNSHGQIVGHGIVPGPALHPFLFDDGIVHDLGSLQGPAGQAWPVAINDKGQVVGQSGSATGPHAFLWQAGTMTDLHDPILMQGGLSAAVDIDRFGTICGVAKLSAAAWQTAVLWKQGSAVALPGLPGAWKWEPLGMNDLGVIVGWSHYGGAPNQDYTKAVMWKNGQVVDLDPFAPVGRKVSRALAILNDGTILAETHLAFSFDQEEKLELMKPICPGGSLAYGTGCAGTGGVVPTLATVNCPTPGNTFALTLEDGPPGAAALILVGSGTGSAPIIAACALQILPLFPGVVAVPLDADGALFLPVTVPANTPPITVTMQALCVDPAAAGGFSSTRPLQLDVQ